MDIVNIKEMNMAGAALGGTLRLYIYIAADATKSLQSYPTLCNPIDGSPPGSPSHGIFQARVLEWGAIAFSACHEVQPKIQFSSVTQSCPTLCDPKNCSTPGFPVHHWLLVLTQTDVHQVGDAIQPSHPLSSPSPPTFSLSSIRVFSKESVLCIRWPKYWSFSLNISPSNEYSGLISFRMDWLDLLAVKGTLKSLLQHHSSKESIFDAQLSL